MEDGAGDSFDSEVCGRIMRALAKRCIVLSEENRVRTPPAVALTLSASYSLTSPLVLIHVLYRDAYLPPPAKQIARKDVQDSANERWEGAVLRVGGD